MAGLSITRRRQAWLKGVAYGASGKGKCPLIVPKLREIFQRGVAHGRANASTPYVRAVVEQLLRRRQPRAGQARQTQQRQGFRGPRYR